MSLSYGKGRGFAHHLKMQLLSTVAPFVPTVGNLTFALQNTATFANQWSAVSPDVSGPFVNGSGTPSGFTLTSSTGTPNPVVSSGVFKSQNTVDNSVQYKPNSFNLTNHYNIEINVVAWGGGTNDQIQLGISDGTNYLVALVDHKVNSISFFDSVAGQVGGQAGPSGGFPNGTTFCFSLGAGNVALFFLRPADTAYQLGAYWTMTSKNLALNAQMPGSYFPLWDTFQSANTGIQVTNFKCGPAGTYAAPANVGVIKDVTTGAPLMTPDMSSIYCYGGISNGVGDSTGIYKVNLGTWAWTEVAQLIMKDSTNIGFGPCTIHWNPNTSQFIVVGVNWDNYPGTPVFPAFGVTSTNLLSGNNTVTVAAMNLPHTAGGGAGSPVNVYDPDIILEGSTYTCAYIVTNATNRWLAVATATSLTGPWTEQWAEATTAQDDGARISQIGGVKVAMSVDDGHHMKVFNRTTGASLGNFTQTSGPAGWTPGSPGTAQDPHPSLAPVPSGSGTAYVIPAFYQVEGGMNSSGITMPTLPGPLVATGAVYMYQAAQVATAPEYNWIGK